MSFADLTIGDGGGGKGKEPASTVTETTVIIVGAGPAGLGIGGLLKQSGLDCILLERGKVGQSFLSWPKETKFISPSFTGNFFGMPDLNAITPDSSPAFGLQTEHPTGVKYAKYLNDVLGHFKLDVREQTNVLDITPALKDGEKVQIKTDKGDFSCLFIVWAGGEFHYPKSIPHTIRVGHGTEYSSYCDLPRGKHVVIGGSESGMDVAHCLVGLGDEVTVIDPTAPWGRRESDSSYGLSPYTLDRVAELKASGKVTFVDERAETITSTTVTTQSHTIDVSQCPPIDATGFDISKSLAGQLFEFDDEGMPNITENDESTAFSNVFLVGPHVAHGNAIFCFIYKYRQRFAVVAR